MSATTPYELHDACAYWQAGRDGSSLLRAGSRVITAIPHYFCADFIHSYEDAARAAPEALRHASVLLNELASSEQLTASNWAAQCGVADQAFAGRGLGRKMGLDEQIETRLDEGTIDMPLWGVSLDPAVADHYGRRFLLEIVNPFPAIPAWLHSSTKNEEQELITGGAYKVVSLERTENSTHARLSWSGPCQPRVLCAEDH